MMATPTSDRQQLDVDSSVVAPTAQPPVADWVSPEEMSDDPYPTYQRLRAESPVAWVPAMNRYLITRYEDCHSVESNQELYTADISAATMNRALGGQPMLRKDDPEHARDRAVINPSLRPKSLNQSWTPMFERNARTYLDALIAVGPDEADLNRDYAAPLASQNLIDLLGLKGVTPEEMRRWSHAFIAGIGNLHDDENIWRNSEEAEREVGEALEELLPYYRTHPDASITSAFANSGLPDDNIFSNVKLVISGGMNEPQHMITNMVWALSRHHQQREEVLNNPELWPTVFDETARWLSPIGMYPRETTRPTLLGDVELPAGAPIGVVVGSANRDESRMPDPDCFNIFREKRPHLAFGSGVHLCAGHWAARISIGRVAVPLLYERLPGLRVDARRKEVWLGWVFRGLTTLPITWDAS